jgi:hypothetical protein
MHINRNCHGGIFGTFLLVALVFTSACREEESMGPGTPEPPSPTAGNTRAGESDDDFLGLSGEAGGKLADRRRLGHRVVAVDGEPRPVTMDYREDRVNFEIEGGKIIKVTRG